MKVVLFAKMGRIQRTIRNETLKNALKNFLVPIVSDKFHIISLRCLWDVVDKDLPRASFNMFSKRNEIENKLESFESVVLFFSCLCAMESSEIKKCLTKRKRQAGNESSDDNDRSYDNENVIPGMCINIYIFIWYLMSNYIRKC